MTENEQKAIEIIAKVAKKDLASIKPEKHLVADLGIDSPRALELMCDLEEELKIEIPEDAVARIETVADVLAVARSA